MSECIESAGGKKFLASHGVDSPAALLLPASSAVILPPARHKALERSDRRWKDSLTGLASSQTILTAIDRVIRTLDPKSPDATLFYINLVDFREVNDNFGQEIGDRLLREVAVRLRELFPGESLVGRIFGDEFALLLRGEAPTPGSPQLATLQSCFETPFMIGDLGIMIGANIGGIVLADSKSSAAEALMLSEEAMKMVKMGEKECLYLADEEMIHEILLRHHLNEMIREAVRWNWFFLLYQPIVDLETGKASGAEALLRIRDQQGTVFPASEFLSAIDRTRHQITVDKWVLDELVHAVRLSRQDLLTFGSFRIAINLSPEILTVKGHAEHCLKVLNEAGISPGSLSIEIEDGPLLKDNPILLANLEKMRSEGAEIAIDHFGTHQINLMNLAALPITTVKIDRSYLDGLLPNHPREAAMLSSLVTIAKNMNFKIVAEGVDDQKLAEHLSSLGCKSAQGYLFGKPMPMGDLLLFIKGLKEEGATKKLG